MTTAPSTVVVTFCHTGAGATRGRALAGLSLPNPFQKEHDMEIEVKEQHGRKSQWGETRRRIERLSEGKLSLSEALAEYERLIGRREANHAARIDV